MPPFVFGRSQFVYPLVVAIAFASAGRAAPPEPVVLKEHTGWIAGVAFSPDGSLLATASADNTVKLWETATWKCTATLKGHTDYVSCVAFSPDEKSLISGSYDGTAIVWDLATRKPRYTLKGHKGAVLTVAVNILGNRLATGGIDGTVLEWSPWHGPASTPIAEHKAWVNAAAYCPTGARFASASSDNTVRIDDVRTTPKPTLSPKVGEVRCLSFSPDGKSLAAGTRYGITKVWNEKYEVVASLKGKHGAEVWGVAFSPDGKVLATADGDWNKPSDVVLWDTHTWKERERLKHTNEVLCIAFHPKKPIVAAGAWDKTVRVWDLSELLKDK